MLGGCGRSSRLLNRVLVGRGKITSTYRHEVNITGERFLFLWRRSLHTPQKFKVVCVEGNIASGKTTFLDQFKSSPDIQLVPEPVNKWRSLHNMNPLGMLYSDPHRWAMMFQTYVQFTMLQSHMLPQTKPVKMMERSIYSAKYCFAENLYKRDLLPPIEYVVLTKWFNWIVEHNDLHVDLIVYLQTSPEVVYERIKQRKREEEQLISLEYLQDLHNLHEEWLIRGTKFPVLAPVLVLDADQDLDKMAEVYREHREAVVGNGLVREEERIS